MQNIDKFLKFIEDNKTIVSQVDYSEYQDSASLSVVLKDTGCCSSGTPSQDEMGLDKINPEGLRYKPIDSES